LKALQPDADAVTQGKEEFGHQAMHKTVSTLLIATLLLTGCGNSRLNPFNWFGRAQSEPVDAAEAEEINPLIPAQTGILSSSRRARNADPDTDPIATVQALRVERVPGGAILRATAVDSRQGAYGVKLVPENDDELPIDGVLTYSLERQLPQEQRPVGPEQTREVIVARAVTDQQLAGVRTIRVVAEQNVMTVRR